MRGNTQVRRTSERAALFLFTLLTAQAAVLDRVAVTIGNDILTESEVLDDIRLTAFLNQAALDFTAPAKRAAAERLVDQYLIRNEMKVGSYPEPSKNELDQMRRQFVQEHFRTHANYEAALRRYGINESELNERLRWQISALRFTEQRFSKGFDPDAAQANVPEGGRNAPPKAPMLAQLGRPHSLERRGARARNRADRKVSDSTGPPAPIASDGKSAGDQTVDDQMETWLKEARTRARIEFKKEAFE